jgi:hypothetical protein
MQLTDDVGVGRGARPAKREGMEKKVPLTPGSAELDTRKFAQKVKGLLVEM